MRTRSFQKYRNNVTTMANWITAVNAVPGSFQPTRAEKIRRCAALLIGRNSVNPWMRPNTAAWSKVIRDDRCRVLAEPRECLLQELGWRGVFRPRLRVGNEFRFHRVLGGALFLVEHAEVAGEWCHRQLIGGDFVGCVVVRGHEVERAALA